VAENEPKGRIIVEHLFDHLPLSHGMNLGKADSTGEVVEEQSMREDERRRTGCRVDLSGEEPGIQVRGERTGRMNNIADENEAARGLAEALSRANGWRIEAIPKEEEDSGFPDIWLRDLDTNAQIGVQIRNFDDEAIADLGRRKGFDLPTSIDSLAECLCEAIRIKNEIDPKLASISYLLLISPYPLPATLHPAICVAVAARNPVQKYRETWVASRGEPLFRVQPAGAYS
jgi:hypothetical protein